MKLKTLFVGTFSLASFLAASLTAMAQSGSATAEPSKVSGAGYELKGAWEFQNNGLAPNLDQPQTAKQRAADFEAGHSFGSGLDRPFGENRVYGSGIFNHSFGRQHRGS